MISFSCDNCNGPGTAKDSEYKRTRRHFCSRKCYSIFRATKLPQEEQHAWKGGITPEESRRRWAEKNKKTLDARAKARKLREINAPGSHTRKEWLHIRDVVYGGRCAEEDATCKGSLTKDHEVPLAFGGSNDPDNLQPLCRSHNSRKSTKVYLQFKSKGESDEPGSISAPMADRPKQDRQLRPEG